MNPLTETQIRSCFVNATRREVHQATLPDLLLQPWDRLDHLGWRDRKAPLSAYVVLELDGALVGLLLRAGDAPASGRVRSAVCTWCQDVVVTEATLYVARRAGAAGRQGHTLGTLICRDFTCSRNVRRRPTLAESGTDSDTVRAQIVQRRTQELRDRSSRFVAEVLSTQ